VADLRSPGADSRDRGSRLAEPISGVVAPVGGAEHAFKRPRIPHRAAHKFVCGNSTRSRIGSR